MCGGSRAYRTVILVLWTPWVLVPVLLPVPGTLQEEGSLHTLSPTWYEYACLIDMH